MDEKNKDLYEGEEVVIRGKTYIVPGLSFGQLEQHEKLLTRMSSMKNKSALTPQIMNDIATVIHLSLSRNYPEMSIKEVKDIVDTRNAARLVQTVMGVSGLEQQPDGAGDTQGETKPVASVK